MKKTKGYEYDDQHGSFYISRFPLFTRNEVGFVTNACRGSIATRRNVAGNNCRVKFSHQPFSPFIQPAIMMNPEFIKASPYLQIKVRTTETVWSGSEFMIDNAVHRGDIRDSEQPLIPQQSMLSR